MTFHPLVDLVRRQFGVEERRRRRRHRRRRSSAGVAEIGEDLARRRRPISGRCCRSTRAMTTCGRMNPAQRRGETFEALRRLLVRAAERRPQVLVIEDLHWIDSASEQFLATLVDSVPALRALLVFTYRPGYASPFGERSYVTRVVPAALSAEDSARMAAAVLATDALPDELRAARRARRPRATRSTSRSWSSRWRRAARSAAGDGRLVAGPAGGADRHSRHRSRT